MKKEVFQEDSFSCYAPSLSRVSKIPRWASLVTKLLHNLSGGCGEVYL